MIKKIVLCIVVFLVSLAIFLTVTVPANFVWHKFVEPQLNLQRSGIAVKAVDGTLWSGRIQMSYQQLDVIAGWDVSLFDFAALAMPLDLRLESHAGVARLSALLGLVASRVELVSADISLADLNPLLKRQRIELSGNIMVSGLVLDVMERRIESAKGLFSWSGGEIAYPAGRQVHKRDMSAFRGEIKTLDDGVIHMGIRDSQAGFDLIEGTLESDGTALMKVKRRLLDLADEPWPQNSKEQDVVFKVKKVIY